MRGAKCWFYHDANHEAKRKRKNFKQNPVKKFKAELNIEQKQEHGANLMLVLLDMLKLLLQDNNIQEAKAKLDNQNS